MEAFFNIGSRATVNRSGPLRSVPVDAAQAETLVS